MNKPTHDNWQYFICNADKKLFIDNESERKILICSR